MAIKMDWIPAKTILQSIRYNENWFGLDYNMNLYKGCCHGCIYCDSRSECYRIENFDTVRGKKDCLSLLEQELKTKRKTGVAGIGAMSDTYNPFEKQYKITRGALKLLLQYGFGVSLATKSDLVTRDIDVLQEITKRRPCLIKITVTAADDVLSQKIEPNVCTSSERLKAVEQLSRNGIFAGILLTPVLPFLTDTEENIRALVHLAKDAGAKFIYALFGVTLRQNQRDYYYQQLDKLFPGLKAQYISAFGDSYECRSPQAKELYTVFREECERQNLLYRMPDIIAAYRKPNCEQISFDF